MNGKFIFENNLKFNLLTYIAKQYRFMFIFTVKPNQAHLPL